MGLSTAFSVAQSSLAAVSLEADTVSRNIAGSNVSGIFSDKTANLSTLPDGSGVQVVSITNSQNQALFDGMLSATSTNATQSAIATGLATLQETVGSTSSDTSPASQISDFIDALQTSEATPSSTSLASAVVTAAQNLTSTLNNATATVQQVRETADQGIASAVSQVNSLLAQFQTVSSQIAQGTATGADITDLEDTRSTILSQLSQQIGISTTSGPDNSMSIYTDSGVTLFQGGVAQTVSFQPTSTFAPGVTGNAVLVDGVPITGSASPMPLQSGAIAGLATLRDDTAVTYQNQLDQIANGLISATSETFTSGGGTVTAPGLFTFAGSTGTPPSMPTSATGLAGTIEVNPAVDPNQGGNPTLIQNGINFDFNAAANNGTDDASFSGQLENLLNNLQANQTFSASGQIATSNTISGFAADSVSWLEAQSQNNSNETTFQSTLLANTTSAFTNATGVSLDSQLSQMLDLEQSYSASAQLLTTVNTMFGSLITSVQTATGSST